MRVFTILLLCSLLFSCQNKEKHNKKQELVQLVNEWQGKEILFPDKLVFTRYLTDTVDYVIPASDYKVVVYVDPLGCTDCKLQLPRWKNFITEVDSISDKTVPFLFFFYAENYKEVDYLLKRDKFNLPISIDREDRLNKLNQFPSDITFQTFLLDKDNKVVVLGNPIQNLAVKDLYLKQIRGKESPKAIQTTAIVETPLISLGTFPQKETRKATFKIKNTGSAPLVILDAATTCGCATVSFEKQPAGPGKELQVEVTMEPKEVGFFDETITVKCNTNKQLKLQITGHAI